MARHGLCLFLLFGSCSFVAAATNPVLVRFPLCFIDEYDASHEELTDSMGDRYCPSNTGWDSCKTYDGTKYCHSHCSFDYPTKALESGITVTQAMADAYWATEYPSPAYTKINSALMGFNCHGYSTSTAHWVEPTTDGMGTVLEHDYEPADELHPEVGFVSMLYGFSHSLRITYTVWLPCFTEHAWVKSYRQKNGPSGIYEFTYDTGNLLVDCYEYDP